VTARVDPRTKALLALDGGADEADLFWHSFLMRGLHHQLVQHENTYADVERAMAPLEPTDLPGTFDPAQALMVNGRYDLFIAPKYAQALSRSLGGAPIVWANTGHYGLAFAEQSAAGVGVSFLRSRFTPGAPAFHPPDTVGAPTIKLGFLLGGHEGVSPAIAYQVFDFDRPGRYSLDAEVTLHGVAAALSARTSPTSSLGVEFPLFHGRISPRPFLLAHVVL
jgi:hypothetical protein